MTIGPASVFHLLRRTTQSAEAELERSLAGLDLTARQFTVLSMVATSPKVSQQGLVEATGIDRTTMADIVGRLVARELLTRVRSVHDARAYELTLSTEGRAIIKKAGAIAERVESTVLSRLPAGGHPTLVSLLNSLQNT